MIRKVLFSHTFFFMQSTEEKRQNAMVYQLTQNVYARTICTRYLFWISADGSLQMKMEDFYAYSLVEILQLKRSYQ